MALRPGTVAGALTRSLPYAQCVRLAQAHARDIEGDGGRRVLNRAIILKPSAWPRFCSGSRTFVHEDIYDEFVAKATELAKKVKLGNPLKEGCEQGPQACIASPQPPSLAAHIHVTGESSKQST